jgi:hypothetical protein
MAQPLWKNLAVSQMVKHKLPQDPAIPFLGTYQRGMKMYVHKNLYSNDYSYITYSSKAKCLS